MYLNTGPALAAAWHSQPDPEPSAEQEIASLRRQIDRIDDLLLQLIQERLIHSRALAARKESDGAGKLLIRPAREQQVLSRLESRAAPHHKAIVAGVWRELMAHSLRAQQPVEIVVHADQEPVLVTDGARLRFGGASPLILAIDAAGALVQARRRPAIAVVELAPLSSWWVPLLDDPELAIFDAVKDRNGAVVALAIGRVAEGQVAGDSSYAIMSEEGLRDLAARGERIRPLAMSGRLRLCAIEGCPPGEAL